MAIVSRVLTLLASGVDPGVKRWRIDAVDALGRVWVHGPFNGTQAEGEAARDAVVFDTAGLDMQELLEFVQLGAPNTVAAFDITNRDITEEEGEEHIYLTFATNDREIALTLAWWLKTLKTGERNTIAARIGFTGGQRGRIHQRYPPMVVVLPWLDAVEEAP